MKGQDRGVTPCIKSRTTFSLPSPSYTQFFRISPNFWYFVYKLGY